MSKETLFLGLAVALLIAVLGAVVQQGSTEAARTRAYWEDLREQENQWRLQGCKRTGFVGSRPRSVYTCPNGEAHLGT